MLRKSSFVVSLDKSRFVGVVVVVVVVQVGVDSVWTVTNVKTGFGSLDWWPGWRVKKLSFPSNVFSCVVDLLNFGWARMDNCEL